MLQTYILVCRPGLVFEQTLVGIEQAWGNGLPFKGSSDAVEVLMNLLRLGVSYFMAYARRPEAATKARLRAKARNERCEYAIENYFFQSSVFS